MSSPASLGLTKEGNEYRILGKKGGLIKINKLTVPQLKAYGAKYTTFTNKNKTKKQVLNKIYAAKTKLREASNSGNSIASALLALQNQPPKSSSPYNANVAAAEALAALGKHKPAGGKARVNALMQIAAQKPSASSAVAAASLGLLPNKAASGGYRFKGAKGPKKANKTMTVAALKAYAAKHGVNASGLKKKDNILKAIHAKKYKRASSSPMNIAVLFKTPSKARPRPAVGPIKPAPASLGLLRQLGASGGYRFQGKKGPKKANKTMTVAALKAYALNHNVNVNGLRKKENILAAIHRKKYGGASSSSSGSRSSSSSSSSRSASSRKVITRSEAARRLKAVKKSSSGPHVRPAVRPKVHGPAAAPKPLTAQELNMLLGN